MANLFSPGFNSLARTSLLVAAGLAVASVALAYVINDSGYVTREDVVREQPVPFSHRHHVQGLGIDCRYCHSAVEESASAGIPPTHTCMTCHSQVWKDAPILEPVRESHRTGKPLRWTRVHDLPDFVYFDHSIHVARGVGCESCHGRVDRMPLVWQEHALHMGWCLDCHRNPEPHLRPLDKVFEMGWTVEALNGSPANGAPANGAGEISPDHDAVGSVSQEALGARFARERGIENVEHCYGCHR